jgi:RNA polymerase sigma factor (sigma-70 family)
MYIVYTKFTRGGFNMSELNDLVIKAKNGDKYALEEIIEMLSPVIYKICSCYFIKNYEIEDLIQIGRMSVVKSIEKYNSNSKASFKTYAASAIENNLKYLLRSEYKRNYEISSNITVEDGITLADCFQDEFNIEEDYCRKESYSTLYKYLNKLEPIYRDILYWVYIDGGKIKDYADRENISIEACRKRKSRALKKLREIMGDFKPYDFF